MRIISFNSIALLLCIILLYGCNQPSKPKTVDQWNGLEYHLTAEEVESDSAFYNSSNTFFCGNYLISRQAHKKKVFAVFKHEGNKLTYINSFLNVGNGPYEMPMADIHYDKMNNSIILTGYNPVGKSFVIPIDRIDNLFDVKTWRVSQYPIAMRYAAEVIPIDTASYIIRKRSDENQMFAVFNARDTALTDLSIPYPDDVTMSFDEKYFMYIGRILKRPSENEFVYTNQIGFFVKIFQYNRAGKVVNEFNLFNEIPEFSVQNNGKGKLDPNNKFGLSLAVSDNYVYCGDPKLTRGEYPVAREKNGYAPGAYKEIYVCNWRGKPKAKLLLDTPIVYMFIDENDDFLYAYSCKSEETDVKLIRFRLPK